MSVAAVADLVLTTILQNKDKTEIKTPIPYRGTYMSDTNVLN